MTKTTPEQNKAFVLQDALIVAEGDYVIFHGRFAGSDRTNAKGQPVAWIAADIVRMENSLLAEH